jgi:hypothetical protein
MAHQNELLWSDEARGYPVGEPLYSDRLNSSENLAKKRKHDTVELLGPLQRREVTHAA